MLTDEPPPGVCAWPVDDCITHLQARECLQRADSNSSSAGFLRGWIGLCEIVLGLPCCRRLIVCAISSPVNKSAGVVEDATAVTKFAFGQPLSCPFEFFEIRRRSSALLPSTICSATGEELLI